MTSLDDSARGEQDVRPQVEPPRAALPPWALGAGAVTAGLLLFVVLNGRRAESVKGHWADTSTSAFAPAPPLSLPAGSDPIAVAPGEDQGRAPVRPPRAYRPYGGGAMARYPAMIPPQAGAPVGPTPAPPGAIANSEGYYAPNGPNAPMPLVPARPGFGSGGGGSSLVYDTAEDAGPAALPGSPAAVAGGEDAPIRATVIRSRGALVAQGEMLPATLETPINSTRPGLIRAVISRDVRSFDGSRVVIPRGSRLVGECRADQTAGQRRILAIWSRLIRPDGVAIRLASPAADAMGGAGIPGEVDTHFLARFANAVLQSALTIAVNVSSRAGNSSIIVTGANPVAGIVGTNLIPGADLPPTVQVKAGAVINVFVAHDLDFSGVPSAP